MLLPWLRFTAFPKIPFGVGEIYQHPRLAESGRRLDNRTHLPVVQATTKNTLVLRKRLKMVEGRLQEVDCHQLPVEINRKKRPNNLQPEFQSLSGSLNSKFEWAGKKIRFQIFEVAKLFHGQDSSRSHLLAP